MPTAKQGALAFSRPEDDSVDLVMNRLPASDLIRVADIAGAMSLSSTVVLAWIDDGRLPCLPCGAGRKREHHRISKNTFRRFLQMRRDGLI